MSFLLSFLPVGYKWLGELIFVGVIALAAFSFGVKITAGHYRPIVQAEHERADRNLSAYLSLETLTDKQSAAISDLQEAAKKREAEAAQAAQEARRAAQPHQDRSAYYLGLKPPQNDSCKEAKDMIDEYAKTRAAGAAGSVRH